MIISSMERLETHGEVPIYGFDLSSRKVAVFAITLTTSACETISVKKSTRPAEIHELYLKTEELFKMIPPGYIYIESPVVGRGGARPTILQSHVDGLIQQLSVRFGHHGVYSVNNRVWKKAVVGKGNATKEAVADWLALNIAVLSDMAGEDQDLIDAACVAIYGLRVIERSEQKFSTLRVDI